MKRDPVLYDDDDTETALPFKWEICGACDGHGKSSAYLGAFTSDEWRDQDDDFREEYMAGRYDRACERCGGSGKVKIADRSRMTKRQRRDYDEQRRIDAEIDAESRAERRMEHAMDCRFAGVPFDGDF